MAQDDSREVKALLQQRGKCLTIFELGTIAKQAMENFLTVVQGRNRPVAEMSELRKRYIKHQSGNGCKTCRERYEDLVKLGMRKK